MRWAGELVPILSIVVLGRDLSCPFLQIKPMSFLLLLLLPLSNERTKGPQLLHFSYRSFRVKWIHLLTDSRHGHNSTAIKHNWTNFVVLTVLFIVQLKEPSKVPLRYKQYFYCSLYSEPVFTRIPSTFFSRKNRKTWNGLGVERVRREKEETRLKVPNWENRG